MRNINRKFKFSSLKAHWWVPVLACMIIAIYFVDIKTDFFRQLKKPSIKAIYNNSNDESKSGSEKALIDNYNSNNDIQSKANNLKSLAFQYIYSGDIDTAINTLEKAKKELPNKNLDYEFYELLANCYLKKGLKTQADINFNRAIESVKSSTEITDKTSVLSRLQEEKQ